MIKRMKKNQDNYTIDSDNLLHRFIKEAIDEARATKSFNTIPELRIKVEFWKIPPPQRT